MIRCSRPVDLLILEFVGLFVRIGAELWEWVVKLGRVCDRLRAGSQVEIELVLKIVCTAMARNQLSNADPRPQHGLLMRERRNLQLIFSAIFAIVPVIHSCCSCLTGARSIMFLPHKVILSDVKTSVLQVLNRRDVTKKRRSPHHSSGKRFLHQGTNFGNSETHIW